MTQWRLLMSDRKFFGLKKKNKYLDQEIVDKLLYAISKGSYIKDACVFAGRDESTFYRWRQKAEEGNEELEELFSKISLTEAQFKVKALDFLMDIATEDRNPRVIQWLLGVKYPEQFGDTSKLQIENTNEVIEVQFANGIPYTDFQLNNGSDEEDVQDVQVEEQEKTKDDTLENHE